MSKNFNYRYYQLAAKIQEWADRLIRRPDDDPQNREYALKEKDAALQECRENRIFPLALAETIKSGSKKGYIKVVVQMPDGTQYGWSYPPEQGKQVYEVLHQEITRWERE